MSTAVNTQGSETAVSSAKLIGCTLGAVYFGGLAIITALTAASVLTASLTIATAILGFCAYKYVPRSDGKVCKSILAMAAVALIASATGVIALGWGGTVTAAIGLGITATLSAGVCGWCMSYMHTHKEAYETLDCE